MVFHDESIVSASDLNHHPEPSSTTIAPGNISDIQLNNYTTPSTKKKPSSTFDRPLTPVPHWPLPSLTNSSKRPTHLNMSGELHLSGFKTSLSGRASEPRSPRLASACQTSSTDRFPPLPPDWTLVHDRAICVLDACNYTLDDTIRKLRSAFPELVGSVLTPAMIDIRLRTLDQNPDVDFFRIGLEHLLTTDDGNTELTKAEGKKRAHIEAYDTPPSVPSFSSLSTDRQNSIAMSGSFVDGRLRITPDSDKSSSSSNTSKTPRPTDKSVIRSYPFDTGFMSYRTTADADETRHSGMTELAKSS